MSVIYQIVLCRKQVIFHIYSSLRIYGPIQNENNMWIDSFANINPENLFLVIRAYI